jgi:mannose-1-phosphate guanylyltransferase
VSEPWCVLLASRLTPTRPEIRSLEYGAEHRPPLSRDPLTAALRRAASITSRERIAAVVAAHADCWWEEPLKDLHARNLFVQPRHQGTGYEVLLALLQLEGHVPSSAPVLFLPADCVVGNEEVMTRTLITLIEWMTNEPQPVYLLGAVPQGPHDQLGYVIPWHDAMDMPTSVYEFVEKPDARQARKLINAGGLWNTFIFGGAFVSLIELFRPELDATILALREALRTEPYEIDALVGIYDRLTSIDFSQHLLAKKTDNLHVLRLPRCGWWPLKSPNLDREPRGAITPAVVKNRDYVLSDYRKT